MNDDDDVRLAILNGVWIMEIVMRATLSGNSQ